MSLMKNNTKLIKSIREETGCMLKEIMEILEMFEQYNCCPEKQDIIDIIRYKNLLSKVKNKCKSVEDYVEEIYKNKYEGRN